MLEANGLYEHCQVSVGKGHKQALAGFEKSPFQPLGVRFRPKELALRLWRYL